jgi:ParB-like chromosome segregation protein Spo0J
MSAIEVRIAFERRILVLPLNHVLPLKQVPDATKKSVRYRTIAQSIAEVGIIEPIVVAPSQAGSGQYMLLDGHMRHAILRERGEKNVRCLVADDDEAFTYNKRVNRLSSVEEHFMLMRALERGVPEEKLAKALNVDVRFLRRRRTMLDGVVPEVVDMLKDRRVSPPTFETLRKMKAMRQIEAAELMCSAANFSSTYAQAILAATKQADLAKPDRPKRIKGMTPEQMARMEREMAALQQGFKAVDTTYADDVLVLVIAVGYLSKLVSNRKVEKYLSQHHTEILNEFRSIISLASLDRGATAIAA